MDKKKYSWKNKRQWIVLSVVAALMLTIMPMHKMQVRAEEKIIRVGYDANSNFVQYDGHEYYGYGVEYLEKIAEYTEWEYEYIKDESWHGSLDKLRNGEIDLLCTVHYTRDRAQEFLFSSIPLGYETSLLYSMPDSSISYQDFDAMQGCKIGLLRESYSAQEFESYAAQKGVLFESVYYEKQNLMMTALETGAIDMMVVGSRYANPDLKLIDNSGANAFFCISGKDNQALVEEINNAIQQIMFDIPTFEGELNEKYFGHSAITSSPLYTKEELEYIESLGTIKIKLIQNQKLVNSKPVEAVRNTANEVLDMIRAVVSKKGRLELPIVKSKYVRKISQRQALQEQDKMERFVVANQIESFEQLQAFKTQREPAYEKLSAERQQIAEQIARLEQLLVAYSEYEPYIVYHKTSNSLKGFAKRKYDREHERELRDYDSYRAELKKMLSSDEKITPKKWTAEKTKLEKRLQESNPDYARVVTELASTEVIEHNRKMLTMTREAEQNQRSQIHSRRKNEQSL